MNRFSDLGWVIVVLIVSILAGIYTLATAHNDPQAIMEFMGWLVIVLASIFYLVHELCGRKKAPRGRK